jgi:Concanavalin A-like lectin/glucanases superfamily
MKRKSVYTEIRSICILLFSQVGMGASSSSTSDSVYQNANNTQQIRRSTSRNVFTLCATFLFICVIAAAVVVPLYEENIILSSSSSSSSTPLITKTQVEATFNLNCTTFNQTSGSITLQQQISDALDAPILDIVVVYFRCGSVIAGIQFLGNDAVTLKSTFLTQAASNTSKLLKNETFFKTLTVVTSIANNDVTSCSTRLCGMFSSSSSTASSSSLYSSSSSSSTGSSSSSSSSTGCASGSCAGLYCAVNPNPCQNGFNCSSLSPTTYTCNCTSSYYAPNCTAPVPLDLLVYMPLNGTLVDLTGNTQPNFTNIAYGAHYYYGQLEMASLALIRYNGAASTAVIIYNATYPTNMFTVSTWVMFSSDQVTYITSDGAAFIGNDVTVGPVKIELYSAYFRGVISGLYCASAQPAIPGQWQFVAMTYNSVTQMAYLYVDGVVSCSFAATSPPSAGQLIYLGNDGAQARYMYGGQANFRLHAVDLSASALLAIRAVDVISMGLWPVGALQLFLPLNGSVQDYSGNNANISYFTSSVGYSFVNDPITGTQVLLRNGTIANAASALTCIQLMMRQSFTFMVHQQVTWPGVTSGSHLILAEEWEFGTFSSHRYLLELYQGAGNAAVCLAAVGTPINAWVHFAVTYDNVNLISNVYQNGQLVCTTTGILYGGYTGGFPNATFLYAYPANSYYANMRLGDYVASAAEIQYWASRFPVSPFPVLNMTSNLTLSNNVSTFGNLDQGHTVTLAQGAGVVATTTAPYTFATDLAAGSVVLLNYNLTQSMTKVAWVRALTATLTYPFHILSSNPASTADGSHYFFVQASTGYVCATLYIQGLTLTGCVAPYATADAWAHYAMSYNATTGNFSLYINGALWYQATAPSNFITAWQSLGAAGALPTQIGMLTATGTSRACEVHQEFMFNRELTNGEIYTVLAVN